MYDVNNQYRCNIIRGKAQKKKEDFIPAYAKIITELCPAPKKEFDQGFNEKILHYLSSASQDKKTLDNHRSEIAGKLLGLYVSSSDGNVYTSERTKKFLVDGDIPALFKDVCFKFQFPNAMQSNNTIATRVLDGMNFRPFCYIVNLLEQAEKQNIVLTKREIGVYVLNALDVLQGKSDPNEILECIKSERQKKIYRDIDTKNDSWDWQHITEQLNLLYYANLIESLPSSKESKIILNHREQKVLDLFSKEWNTPLPFEITKEDVSDSEHLKDLRYRWSEYFGKLSPIIDYLDTKIEALNIHQDEQSGFRAYENTVELGDEGENFVFNYEKNRVGKFNPRLTNKVILFGKQKGLGYDIQSVMAVKKIGDDEYPEMGKYIEVKSTRRVTAPKIEDIEWYDSVNITRNEWVSAKEKQDSYFIYRVFFTRSGVFIYTIQNPYKKNEDGRLPVTPLAYRLEIAKDSVDEIIDIKIEDGGKNA